MPLKYICITSSGGGARGLINLGVTAALHQTDIPLHVQGYSGSSAGAIESCLNATGITAEDKAQFSESVDFTKLLGDRVSTFSTARTGTPLYRLIRQRIKLNIFLYFARNERTEEAEEITIIIAKSQSPKSIITFGDLTILQQYYPTTFKHLAVTAVNQKRGGLRVFRTGDKHSANIEIALTIRASASLPVILAPVNIQGEYYIDGGYANNTPTGYAPTQSPGSMAEGDEEETLVFIFADGDEDFSHPIYKALHTRSSQDEELVQHGWARRSFYKLVKKAGGIGGNYTHTDASEAILQKLQREHQGHTVILWAGSVNSTDFVKASQLRNELWLRGYIPTAAHLINKRLLENSPAFKLLSAFFKQFIDVRQKLGSKSSQVFNERRNLKAKTMIALYMKLSASTTKAEIIETLQIYIATCCYDFKTKSFSFDKYSAENLIDYFENLRDVELLPILCKALGKIVESQIEVKDIIVFIQQHEVELKKNIHSVITLPRKTSSHALPMSPQHSTGRREAQSDARRDVHRPAQPIPEHVTSDINLITFEDKKEESKDDREDIDLITFEEEAEEKEKSKDDPKLPPVPVLDTVTRPQLPPLIPTRGTTTTTLELLTPPTSPLLPQPGSFKATHDCTAPKKGTPPQHSIEEMLIALTKDPKRASSEDLPRASKHRDVSFTFADRVTENRHNQDALYKGP